MTISADQADQSTAMASAISLSDVLRGLGRRKRMIISLTVLAGLAGFLVARVSTPIYSTESKILIANQETPFDRVQAADNQASSGVDDRMVASQISVVQSADLARRVIASLKLEDRPEFNPLLKGLGKVSQIKLAMGFGEDPRRQTPEQRVLQRYDDKLAVYQIPNSNVIGIKYSSTDPKTAADVANTLAGLYIESTRESQTQPTERARDWLARQIDELRAKLANSEKAVETFRAEAGLLQGASSTLGTQQISELNSQLTAVQSTVAEAQAKANSIRDLLARKGSVETASDVLASSVIQALKEQKTEAARLVAELSATYLPSHPKLIAAQSQISNIDKQIRAEALRIAAGLEEQARVAEARERALRDELDKLKQKAATSNLDDVKLKALEREAAADRSLLETMLSRYAEASARLDQDSQPGMARIIETADVPSSPSFPKTGPLVLLSSLGGLALGLGLAFLLEIMAASQRLAHHAVPMAHPRSQARQEPLIVSERIASTETPRDQPSSLTEPDLVSEQHREHVLATIGMAGRANSDGMLASGAEALSRWATPLVTDNKLRRIGVVETGGCGHEAAWACWALARAFVNASRKVVIVDLDHGGSALEDLAGIAEGPGFSDLVAGRADFTRIIARDSKSAAHLLRFGQAGDTASKDKMEQLTPKLLSALAQTYDLLIVFTGEDSAETEAALFSCDSALIVAHVDDDVEADELRENLGENGVSHVGELSVEGLRDDATTAALRRMVNG